jgi:peptidyl-prolyl cis-trans isomerase B (cyclophilin B)
MRMQHEFTPLFDALDRSDAEKGGAGADSAGGGRRHRRRFWLALVIVAVLVMAVLAGAFALLSGIRLGANAQSPALSATAGGAAGASRAAGAPCVYRTDNVGGQNQRLVPLPPARPTRAGPVPATIRTALGDIALELDATRAPCTVNAIASLVHGNYYTETDCHRLTTADLWVVQCGDPSGTGAGAPGYRYDDENKPPAGNLWTYQRGTVAMVNAGPGTNGAQFLIMYRDSELGPDYPIVGKVTGGLDLIDRVAAAGTDDGSTDGRPKLPLHITRVDLR